MTKEEKLLHLMMGDGASDGEIINARNMLKKMGVKLSIGENSHIEDYINLSIKHANLQGEYQTLYSKYNYLHREYNNIMNQKMDRYKRQLRDLNKKLEDREVEMTKLSYYLNATSVLAMIFGLMFFGSLVLRG